MSVAAEQPLRLVVAEDSALMRQGLCRLLADNGFDVVAEVDHLDALLLAVKERSPDVVITDIRMPPTGTDEGLRAAEAIHRDHPGVGVLVLSQYLESRHALTLMTSNASGVG
ncbi:MAG: response regulator transcription factor, partial [Frankia sp.]|nr:response regulator transcription factor [Frankia sp.]